MFNIDLESLLTLDRPVPRYTSYPTAPEWGIVQLQDYKERLRDLKGPSSLYVHIPFCKTMCLYCACSVTLNRLPENETRYVDYLLKEIKLVSALLDQKKIVQLHFGGGTPTQLAESELERLFLALWSHFEIDLQGEIAIEIDPRTVGGGRKLELLKHLGFNRVSLGVQDTNPRVQAAVRRYQSFEMTRDTFYKARSLGFSGINIDLIYGLPFQTLESFTQTIQQIIELQPDRIALFSYAKVPWLKPHQKAIRDETLPSTVEKFTIYREARLRLQEAGYVAIGMDHFAKKDDELAIAYHTKTLRRNFQGYTVLPVDTLIGLGVTSIGSLDTMYVQNMKELKEYYAALDNGVLPIERGKILDMDDYIRRFVIQRLMCNFVLDKQEMMMRFGIEFDTYFLSEREKLREFQDLVEDRENELRITPKGELFIRIVVSTFDRYLQKNTERKFSKSI